MLAFDTLPIKTQVELNRIFLIDVKDLKKDDKEFLKALSQYLRPEQVTLYADILGVKKAVEPKK